MRPLLEKSCCTLHYPTWHKPEVRLVRFSKPPDNSFLKSLRLTAGDSRWLYIFIFILINSAFFGLTVMAQAALVGNFVGIEGRVDLLRGGKLPAIAAKLQDQVAEGDVIRTKSDARAEIRFTDESSITLGPGSRLAIENYTYDAARGQRQAVLQLFMGIVHTVVKKIYPGKEPDFILKTQTSVIGVRGTDWYSVLGINVTDIYNGSGTTEVRNIYPEVPGKVELTGMEFSRVALNLPPTLPLPIDQKDLDLLKAQLSPQPGRHPANSTLTPPMAPTEAKNNLAFLREALGQDNPLTQTNLTVPPIGGGLMIAPVNINTNGSGVLSGAFASATITGSGVMNIAGIYSGTYNISSLSMILTATSGSFGAAFNDPGSWAGSLKGTLSGVTGQNYSGTASGTINYTGVSTTVTTLSLSGPLSIGPGGKINYQASGTFTTSGGGPNPSGTVTGQIKN